MNGAGVGAQRAGEHRDAGGLARAVRTEEPDDLADGDPQRDPVDDGPVAEPLAQGVGSQHRRRRLAAGRLLGPLDRRHVGVGGGHQPALETTRE
ncbi:MAG: hypothetical protein AUG49_14700 [Catenulispora sp. 13_1_20CM_3_70_7]|nr:MAG: hypothetical protein AUG49_14700 [Catenulispora sp. 13_1_20CM_3_70_7]